MNKKIKLFSIKQVEKHNKKMQEIKTKKRQLLAELEALKNE